MKVIVQILLLVLFVLPVNGQTGDNAWKPIFDGNDLEQWRVPKKNIWWSIDNRTLWAKSDPDKIGSILWTKKSYTDFMVQMDFKFGEGVVDTGIYMRGDNPRNVQVQIGISGSLKKDMTASPYVPTLGYPVEASGVDALLDHKGWNTIRAMTIGNTYIVWLNGVEVMNYELEKANLKGPIGLQLHPGNEMTVQFRNIMVNEL
ncbi:DUF1080 domain-containing protein [Maribacter confluentis]|uniref:DUF1080 domain-containing protein n=1 Tax=Maribacter confluentis TaxID=1656093 RepID=A0ABT8RS94_9FLAO|nr:DUF1080 domain-containing protein [Maribacter confluentis]MDO1513287.1 DUF1080 domain-containing protein [Maribacter confluentis]